MASTFSVRNFEKFQHYKDRSPPWIKFHNAVLDDYDLGALPDASKAHLFAIWLLASRYDNKIPADAAWVARRINATDPVDLDLLAKAGFIELNQGCSETLAPCKQDAGLEREERESREEKNKGADAPKYAFQGEVVRLTDRDFATWEATFRHIPNLRAELTSRDAWLAEQDDATRKKWFQSTSTWLRNRDAEFSAKPKPAEPAKRPTASSISDANDFDPMKPFRPCAKGSPAEAEQLAWMDRKGKWADWDQRRAAQ